MEMRIKPHGIALAPVQFWLLKLGKTITNTTFYSAIAGFLCLMIAFGVRIRFKEISAEKLILLMFVLYIVSELCIPAVRGQYSFMLWLFGAALIIAQANIVEAAVMLLGLLIFYHLPHVKNSFNGFGELIMLLACLMFLFRKSQTPHYLAWLKECKLKSFLPTH
jgi:hypothetical protein